MTYLTEEQHSRWKDEAERHGVSLSQFIQDMTEAGIKKFDLSDIEPDEENDELRRQRNDLLDELEHARKRIEKLEAHTHHTEQDAIVQFVRDNPGADFTELTNHLIETTDKRTSNHLSILVDERIREEDECYYPINYA